MSMRCKTCICWLCDKRTHCKVKVDMCKICRETNDINPNYICIMDILKEMRDRKALKLQPDSKNKE